MHQTFTRNTRVRVGIFRRGRSFAIAAVVLGCLSMHGPSAEAQYNHIVLAAGPPQASAEKADDQEEKLTPEQRMARRFPQPVQVGFLIGLPVLDGDDATIGYVTEVVRTAEGKIQLIVPYATRFGWLRNGTFVDRWRRPVAVPIETVAILARHVLALEMSREDFDGAPTFSVGSAPPIDTGEKIQIALGRR
jgi:hypothetical protein